MLLHDLVKVEERAKTPASAGGTLKEVLLIKEQYEALVKGSDLFGTAEKNALLAQAHKTYAGEFTELRSQMFEETLSLTEGLKKSMDYDRYYNKLTRSDDVYTQLSETPVASLPQVRAVADALQMIIIPMAWLSNSAFQNEPSSTRQYADGFWAASRKAGMNTFVVTPLAYYSVGAHARAQDPNLPIYGGSLQMIITSITLSIPLFRTLLAEVENVKGQLNSVDNRLTGQLEGMQSQINMLQQQIKKVQEDAARAAEEARKATAAAAKAKAEAEALKDMIFYANDPMMFSMYGTDLLGDRKVLLGPCWGPEFSPDLAGAYKLPVFPGQRKMIGDSHRNLVGYR